MVTAVLRKDIAKAATRPLAAILLSAILGVAALAVPSAARAQTPSQPCDNPLDMLRLAHPLARVGHKLMTGDPITIVAMGSSSTWGAGASSPAANYPNQLAADLKARFPKHSFTVLNAGVGGEEVGDMLKRFDTAVVAVRPDLVLWQLGTNSIIRDHKVSEHGATIREGLRKIRSIDADVVLIDPQFVPKVIAKPEAERMVEMLATTAKQQDVDLFRRFDVMKRWSVVDKLPFEQFVSPDGLHLNDWGYSCMAKGLGMVIAEAAQRPVLSATAGARPLP
jgi:lysophospholipase L1-like esterase